jgi:sialic acid synthase SpsE
MGAAVIEKHLTLDRQLPGPDHAASLEPDEMVALVTGVRDAHAARGDGHKAPRPDEDKVRAVARRSLVVTRPIPAGTVIAASDLGAMRPEGGISPLRLDEVVGRRAALDLAPHRALRPDDLDPPAN